jgi:hypothetical protein
LATRLLVRRAVEAWHYWWLVRSDLADELLRAVTTETLSRLMQRGARLPADRYASGCTDTSSMIAA